MTKKRSNVVGLATKNKKRGKTQTKKVQKPQTTEVEDKDKKAKETVDNLLKDLPLNLKKDEELLELDEEGMDGKSEEWLQEQVSKLAQDNETLRKEAAEAKSNYKKIFDELQNIKRGGDKLTSNSEENLIPDSVLKNNIIALFDEAQKNMLGMNQQRTPYKNMSIRHLLIKMLELFPFTSEIRKF